MKFENWSTASASISLHEPDFPEAPIRILGCQLWITMRAAGIHTNPYATECAVKEVDAPG